ncbi:uncharacterized protein B4U79_08207 [Dinothrombium tinctorium]|uniref:Transcription cofactor vestigial-like protein 4 n=1 Tax=Dinothrombium tinctorium TaxID=1965070 RepID=A0A3S3Q2W1_9ACAR|nr:uncharacterized protein B4U79_07308 [Dinothrombium tinctorium]RWS05978.1 uncharacterized protein B4U79_06068 [Dinothrombium tinctorium]RWS07810.1 uncharacterized protein B4U79_04392 [Dinothrombium tinctorium]RWS07835.1 uncharacterized protein B4U79_08207 [Dinothrombium tinctorium]
MKRSKDRRELAHSSSFRLRRSISPHLIDERSNPESFEAFQRLNSPLNVNYAKPMDAQSAYPILLNVCRRERSSSSCSFAYRGSPYEINCPNGEVHLIRRNSDPNSARHLIYPSDNCEEEQPLDMTKKSRTSSDSESQSLPRSEVSTPETTNNLQQMRPSVITCAPSLRPKLTVSPNCQSCNLSNDMEKCSTTNKESVQFSDHNCNAEVGQRKQILTGACDPDIDEHFRRSLGKDYSEIFMNNNNNANNTPSASMSVDDHFAKALGDTWRKLQEKDKEVSSEKGDANKTQRISTKNY